MSQSHFATYIELPREADPDDPGPFQCITRGLATGVYAQRDWPKVSGLVKCQIPRNLLDPSWCLCDTRNQATWFVQTGLKLDPSELPSTLLPHPRRKIQPPEILSMAYPPGSTIIIEPSDEVLPYSGRRLLPVTVSISRSPTSSAPIFSSASQKSTQYSASDVRSAMTSREAATAARVVVSAPFTSNTFGGGSASQKGKMTYVSLAPTLVASDTRASTPEIEIDSDNNPFLPEVYYHKSTYVPNLPRRSASNRSPERGSNQWDEPQPSSSQQSSSSQSDTQVVSTQGLRRLRALCSMRYPDHDIEAQINAYVIVHMLHSVHLSAKGLEEVKEAAAVRNSPEGEL